MSRKRTNSSSLRQRTSGACVKDTSAEADDTSPDTSSPSWHDDDNVDTVKGEKEGFQHLFGFHWRELSSFQSFVRLLCRPCDPASLGTLRFIFGLMMLLDCVQERGLAMADSRWGPQLACRFPFFHFLEPLPLQWMYIVYLVMAIGAAGIMFGFMFRTSCALFLGPYWYIFFLDKASWNNHSYLFGILAFLFAISDANRYWSIDGLINQKICNAHVPLWNYTLMRAQIFLVYFIAGLKKMDSDWVHGYSMENLSEHWVFSPFKLILTEPQVNHFVVHIGGLTIDTFIGFLLFFDKTRPVGLVISTSFHLMNSQLFSIGMFPYAMLATQLLFCSMSWPRAYFKDISPVLQLFTPAEEEMRPSDHCLYGPSEEENSVTSSETESSYSPKDKPLHKNKASFKQKAASVFTVAFIAWQCFLPYSHGLTKGYNNWTNGLYGYSWDMMIHHWYVQHVRITFVDKDTGQSGYLDPTAWTDHYRWSSHGDMVKQYAMCIADYLKNYNYHNVEIYFDIWRSLNGRFQQRMINPHVDMVQAEWHPFKESTWVMPLMVDLSDWRGKFAEIEQSLEADSFGNPSDVQVVFVADFPGLYLENYVQPDFGNTSLSVLDGKVIVQLLDSKQNFTLGPGESLQIPANTFHNVHTVSSVPSCYMYMFVNTTEQTLMEKFSEFEAEVNNTSINETLKKYNGDPNLESYKRILEEIAEYKQPPPTFKDRFIANLRHKYKMLYRSVQLTYGAVLCFFTNQNFHTFVASATTNSEL